MFTQYLTSSLKEADQEIEEMIFEFEKEELTLEILDQPTPGWTIDTLETPCIVSQFCCEHIASYTLGSISYFRSHEAKLIYAYSHITLSMGP